MHIHILGICGTFMGGVAQLARAAGHKVSGCDANVYPPMSDQLEAAGIELTQGWGVEQMDIKPDLWVVGNAVSRGNPLLEAILESGQKYVSGPQWISEHVLDGRHVLAVAGTHGKTTTTSMLAWILEACGLEPGFLIGGVPEDFGVSARLGNGKCFVIEADEYDTAFCDKRSKFVHYRPRTAILNNLEFDHADIFENLAAIEKSFHHMVRTMAGGAKVVSNGSCEALERVLDKGCWSRLERFGSENAEWQLGENREVLHCGTVCGVIPDNIIGRHNALNALAAVAAASDVGVEPAKALAALATFKGVKRRLEIRGCVNGVTVVDDFAHHPTAISETIAALRGKVGNTGRILAVLEPRSNTMKLGTMKSLLAGSLTGADLVFCYSGSSVRWDAAEALLPLGDKVRTYRGEIEDLVADTVAAAREGDWILCMSNGGFCGVHGKLLAALGAR